VECKERDRLLSEYNSAVIEASGTATTLSKVAGDAPLDAYGVLLREQDKAETKTGKARSEYEQHIINHSCAVLKDSN
jgi:hypothetical protein